MLTFRQQFKLYLFVVIFSGCNPVFAETVEATDNNTHHAQSGIDWPGIYLGFTPCDDCKGVKTTLALNKNNSYLLITQYIGKSPREIVEKGRFTWGDANNTIVLTPRDNSTSTTRQYFVGENILIELDKNGNRITGKLANRYILRRKDMTQSTPSHSGH